jgi:hypothetical protein
VLAFLKYMLSTGFFSSVNKATCRCLSHQRWPDHTLVSEMCTTPSAHFFDFCVFCFVYMHLKILIAASPPKELWAPGTESKGGKSEFAKIASPQQKVRQNAQELSEEPQKCDKRCFV